MADGPLSDALAAAEAALNRYLRIRWIQEHVSPPHADVLIALISEDDDAN